MKSALIAAGALAAATFATTPDASAKGMNFALTIGGPEGYIQIGGPGKHGGPNYGMKGYGHKGYGHKGYGGPGPGYGRGYGQGYGYGGPQNLGKARAYGHCLNPYQIRQKLHYEGWRGFRMAKLTPKFAVVHSFRHGTRYRLKVDRCTGYIAKVKPIGGYHVGGYW